MSVMPPDNRLDKLSTFLTLGGAVAVIVGSFLPWATVTAPFVGHISKAGTDGDGKFTLVVGIAIAVLAAVALAGYRNRILAIAILVLAGVAFAVTLIDLVDINQRSATSRRKFLLSPLSAEKASPSTPTPELAFSWPSPEQSSRWLEGSSSSPNPEPAL